MTVLDVSFGCVVLESRCKRVTLSQNVSDGEDPRLFDGDVVTATYPQPGFSAASVLLSSERRTRLAHWTASSFTSIISMRCTGLPAVPENFPLCLVCLNDD